jgi:hypothetical protein
MSTQEQKHAVAERPRDPDPPAAEGAPAKKPCCKPTLSKYEQLHGIGLGSAD